MPSAIPTDAADLLPKARMIDPRGHRFGAGVSALLLIGAFLTGTTWLVGVVLLSIGLSAAFGLRFWCFSRPPASAWVVGSTSCAGCCRTS